MIKEQSSNSEVQDQSVVPIKRSIEGMRSETVDPAEERRRQLEKQVQKLKQRGGGVPLKEDRMLTDDELFRRESDYGFSEGEEVFNVDAPLPPKVYPWAEKYQPKKPRYYNRVNTGYEWNKYNQTHYDEDNPPPKIVQGYKFNIFFPELIEKNKTPQYFLEKSENPDFVIIRFTSGAPYEDIGFRIVNKEWEYSHKKGFRCTFERGILHLHFQFKKYRYRS